MKGKSEFLDDEGEFDGEKGYGAVLGTFIVCAWVEVALSFVRPNVRGRKEKQTNASPLSRSYSHVLQ